MRVYTTVKVSPFGIVVVVADVRSFSVNMGPPSPEISADLNAILKVFSTSVE